MTQGAIMRKIRVQTFMTLDGVMQAPGGPEEDASNGFPFGGWTAPYFAEADEAAGAFMARYMTPSDLLLGRRTFEIFANYWPEHSEMWPGIDDVTKYVVSSTLDHSDVERSRWAPSTLLTGIDEIKELKRSGDSDLQVHGSSVLAQSLFSHDLVDDLWLMIFPVVLGTGKHLFANGALPAAYAMTESLVTPNGVIFAYYQRAGEVELGTVGI
jgi:dihydrofolate reductase